MENVQLSIEEHLKSSEQIFSQPTLSVNDINAFIKNEMQLKGYEKPEYKEDYAKIFSIIRDKIILPNAGKLELLEPFEDLYLIFNRFDITLDENPSFQVIANSLTEALSTNTYDWQFRIVRMLLIVHSFNSKPWETEFAKLLFDLPSAACFRNMDDVRRISNVIRTVFRDCKHLLTVMEQHTFGPDLFDKELFIQRSNFMWILEVIWNAVFANSTEHIIIIPKWYELFREAIKRNNRELVFYMHTPLSHVYLNLCETQEQFKTFNEEVEMPLSKYIQSNMRKWGFKPVKKKISSEKRKNIAFLFDRIVGNSPTKLLISWLMQLKEEDNANLFVYDMAYIEKAVSDPSMVKDITDLGVSYVNLQSLLDDKDQGHHYCHFKKAAKMREKAIEDDIDTLITIGNRMPSGFMFATRTAPEQIFWDHGNHEYDIKNIDKRICHFDDGYRNSFTFERFELRLAERYLLKDREESAAKAKNIRQSYPENTIILGSIGRLMKLSKSYLECIKQILDETTDTIYLACGTGNREELRQNAIEVGIPLDRFILAGWVEPHLYSQVIDVYLNTFPLPSGESINEYSFANNGACTVSLSKLDESSTLDTEALKRRYIHRAMNNIEIVRAKGRDFTRNLYDIRKGEDGSSYEPFIPSDSEALQAVRQDAADLKNNTGSEHVYIHIMGDLMYMENDLPNHIQKILLSFSSMLHSSELIFIVHESQREHYQKVLNFMNIPSEKFVSLEYYLMSTYCADIIINIDNLTTNIDFEVSKLKLSFAKKLVSLDSHEKANEILDELSENIFMGSNANLCTEVLGFKISLAKQFARLGLLEKAREILDELSKNKHLNSNPNIYTEVLDAKISLSKRLAQLGSHEKAREILNEFRLQTLLSPETDISVIKAFFMLPLESIKYFFKKEDETANIMNDQFVEFLNRVFPLVVNPKRASTLLRYILLNVKIPEDNVYFNALKLIHTNSLDLEQILNLKKLVSASSDKPKDTFLDCDLILSTPFNITQAFLLDQFLYSDAKSSALSFYSAISSKCETIENDLVIKSLQPLINEIFQHRKNESVSPLISIINEMLISEYNANNISKDNMLTYLRTMASLGDYHNALNLLQAEIDKGNIEKYYKIDFIFTCTTHPNNDFLPKESEMVFDDIIESCPEGTLLRLAIIYLFMSKHSEAVKTMNLLHKKNINFFTDNWSYISFLSIVHTGLQTDKSDRFYEYSKNNDPLFERRKYIWDIIPKSNEQYSLSDFNTGLDF